MTNYKNKVREIIKNNYNLNMENTEEAVVDIVERCFCITGIPKDEELEEYVREYCNR